MIDDRFFICDMCSNLVPFVVWCPKTYRMYCPRCVEEIGHEPPYTRFELWLRRIKVLIQPPPSGGNTLGNSTSALPIKRNEEPQNKE